MKEELILLFFFTMLRIVFLVLSLSLNGFCQILLTDDLSELLNVGNRFALTPASSCYRKCSIHEPVKVCYYRFVVENFMSNSVGCDSCTPNATTLFNDDCQCVLGDGFERSTLAINRHIPGPSIQVCRDDRVVIDVSNKIQAEELSIHWHGIFQRGTPWYDGVPMVTQCPIGEGMTFRYQWVAEQSGTHLYHSHSGIQEINGVYGSIIVREPPEEDVHSKLYDTDRADHVIVISEWMHELAEEHFPGRRVNVTGQTPETFLINGRGLPYNSPVGTAKIENFIVTPGQRHRFRLINAFASVCPSAFAIEKHRLKVIAVDGAPIQPKEIDTIASFTGERYDFILEAKQTPGIYWIQLKGLGECGEEKKILQIAQITYQGFKGPQRRDRPTYQKSLPYNYKLNPFDYTCNVNNPKMTCIDKLRSVEPVDKAILKPKPDYKIFLSFLFKRINATDMYRNKIYENYLVAPGNAYVQSLINSISFTPPASPLLSQFADVERDSFICNFADKVHCKNGCSCVHLLEFPLNSVIEMIVLDEAQVPALSHPFHLHGQEFFVLEMGVPKQNPNGTLTVRKVIDMDRRGELRRNLISPPAKDTLAVPRSGYIIIRFHATNPGFWLLHCHFNFHIVIGMDLVVRIGTEKDLPPVPKNFPKCGDYTPAIFPNIRSSNDLRRTPKPSSGGHGQPGGGYDKPSSGGHGQPGGGYDKPSSGGHGQPGGGYDRPSGGHGQPGGGYDRPSGGHGYPGGYDKPSSGHGQPGGYDRPSGGHGYPGGYDKPSSGGHGQPGGYDRPSGGHGQPGGYDRPSGGHGQPGGGYDRPSGGHGYPGGYDKPSSGGYGQPGGYDRPSSGGYDKPSSGGYGQPGGYDRPSSGGYDKPSSGGYGKPGGYDKPSSGGYGQPGGYGKPSSGGYGQPSKKPTQGYGDNHLGGYNKPSNGYSASLSGYGQLSSGFSKAPPHG